MNVAALIVLFGLSLAVSCVFSGMEAGVFGLNRVRIRHLKKLGDRRAEVLNEFLERPERFLWAILVGNTMANFLAASLIVLFLKTHLGEFPGGFWAAFVLMVFLLLYGLCDLLPKMFFRLFPNHLCLALARPFRGMSSVLTPLVDLVTWVAKGLLRWSGGKKFTGNLFGNREELRLFVQESGQSLTGEERAMINRVLDLQKLRLQNVAIPLEKAVTVTAKTPLAEVMEIARQKNVTRLPVWEGEGGARRILGILSLRSALYRPDFNPDLTAAHYVRPALYLDADARLEVALARLQRAGETVAIVLDRNRKETGMASLKDILKTVFGEVQL